MSDFIEDVETILDTGESSDEKRIRKEREQRIKQAYGQAQRYEQNKYLGPAGENISKLQELRSTREWMLDMAPGGAIPPGDVKAIQRLDAQIAQLEGDIQRDLQYQPDFYTPETNYDVTGYDVARPDDISEAKTAHLLEALYPDKYNIPKYEDAAMQAPSEAAKAKADAASLSAARSALGSIEDVYKQGGLTPADRARIQQIQQANAQEARAAREAVLSDLAQKGMATSGNRVLGMLSAAQGSADRNNAMGLGVEQLAEQRALEAMQNAGTLGRTLSQDEFNREYATGAAADEVNRFNTIGLRDVEADTRRQQDAYREWQRAMLEGDVDAMRAIEEQYARDINEQNAYLSDKQNQESQWGAIARNNASQFNTANQTAANLYNNQNMWNQLLGYNNQQTTLGNLELGKAGSLDAITAAIPASDPGAVANNIWNVNKAIGQEVQNWIPWTKAANSLPGGGGGGGNQGYNPINTR